MSNKFFNFSNILFFYQCIYIIDSVCPPDLILKPCFCGLLMPYNIYSFSSVPYGNYDLYEQSIECSNIYNSSFDLQVVFLKLNSYSNIISNDDENATHFNYFILSNTTITSIPENVFVNITFKSLKLQNNFQLTTIDQNAFSYGKDYVESFETINTSLSDSETIFSIIKQFQNLRHLSMQNDRLKSIPSYAFNHAYLSHIYFGSEYPKQTQPIESIGDYAFYNLPSLHFLRIFSPNLTKITKYAFALRKRILSHNDDSSSISLYLGGEGLTSDSFELTSLNRFRNHHVFLRLYSTSVTYLDENIFQPFLEANPSSAIDMDESNKLFKCDCRSDWIRGDYYQIISNLKVHGYTYRCESDLPKNCTINK